MSVVRASWDLADVGHVPRRADYVPRAREIMAAVGAVVSGRRPTLADALKHVPAAGDHGQ
jgi:hypothetical protein